VNKTADYPGTLSKTIDSIQASLPIPEAGSPSALKRVQDIVSSQENLVRSMASGLENLVMHYDNMANTLKGSESGVDFTDEELVGEFKTFFLPSLASIERNIVMNRDTQELAAIMSEMERDMKVIEEFWYASFTHSRI